MIPSYNPTDGTFAVRRLPPLSSPAKTTKRSPVAKKVKICDHCGVQGHTSIHADGSIWCFKLLLCDVCGSSGHDEAHCRRTWCETCRNDGLGNNFVGHTTDRCFKNQICSLCNASGHLAENCRTCSKCNRNTHSTAQCEVDVTCTICNSVGHSENRCRACFVCGFRLPSKNDDWVHKCKRTNVKGFIGECVHCSGVGSGKCDCNNHIISPKKK
jgi:hypothetical protein